MGLNINNPSGKFYERGDPAAEDFAVGDLTCDNTWRVLDLSAIVPAGCSAVLLRVGVQDNNTAQYVHLRAAGNANTINKFSVNTQVANILIREDAIVALNRGQTIEYRALNAGWTAVNITVAGWWRP